MSQPGFKKDIPSKKGPLNISDGQIHNTIYLYFWDWMNSFLAFQQLMGNKKVLVTPLSLFTPVEKDEKIAQAPPHVSVISTEVCHPLKDE